MLAEPVPIILRQAIFDRDDGELLDPRLVEGRHLGAGLLALTRFRQVVGPVLVEGTGRRVQGDRDVLARHVTCRLDGLDNHLACFLVALEIRSEATFIADTCGIATLVQDTLQGVECLGPVAERLGEIRCPDGHDHEFLKVHAVVGVLAAVEDVHHWHRQPHRPGPAQIGV